MQWSREVNDTAGRLVNDAGDDGWSEDEGGRRDDGGNGGKKGGGEGGSRSHQTNSTLR